MHEVASVCAVVMFRHADIELLVSSVQPVAMHSAYVFCNVNLWFMSTYEDFEYSLRCLGYRVVNVFVSLGLRARPNILGCVCMSSVMLLICKLSLVLYSASRVNNVVLSDWSMRWMCMYVYVWLYMCLCCRYVVVCCSDCDVVCMSCIWEE